MARFVRQESLALEGQLVIEFALGEDEDDRLVIDGFDLHDLIASQFSDPGNYSRRQRLGKFRVVFERVSV